MDDTGAAFQMPPAIRKSFVVEVLAPKKLTGRIEIFLEAKTGIECKSLKIDKKVGTITDEDITTW